MIGDTNNLKSYTYPILPNPIDEVKELWRGILDICKSHQLLFDLYNMQQERIIHLENMIGSSAILPKSM